MTFASKGRTLVIAGFAGPVVLWDLSDRAHPRPLPTVGDFSIDSRSVALAPNEGTLAAGTDSGARTRTGAVALWDLSNPARPRRLGQPLTGLDKELPAVAFAPDEQTLATGGLDGTVILWDLSDRAHPRRLGQPLTGLGNDIRSVTFAPDGRTLATIDGNTIVLWDLSDRTHPRRLGQPITGLGNAGTPVAFAPDGRTLATGTLDGTMVLWDLSDRAQPRRLGQPLTVSSSEAGEPVSFSPDGRTLATGGSGTVILWDLSELTELRHHAAAHACSLTKGGLSRDDWARYVAGLQFQNTCPS